MEQELVSYVPMTYLEKIIALINQTIFSFYAYYMTQDVKRWVWFDMDIYATITVNIKAEQKEHPVPARALWFFLTVILK